METTKRLGYVSIKSQLVSPPINRSMSELDRSFFTKKFNVWSLYFPDPTKIGAFVRIAKEDILQVPHVPFIIKYDGTKGEKGVVLTDRVISPEDVKIALQKKTLELIDEYHCQLRPYEIVIDYNYWKTDEILRAILPDDSDEEIPSGFTRTGHIAHINLKDDYKKYDKIIGTVILDKNPSIKTVVDKVDTIDTTFRTFKMKVIAGEPNFIVEQRESDCLFKFDFSKVYWNSRLHTEHKRLVDIFTDEGGVGAICDVMAGVGPFAIPSGKNQLVVFANDLNPESYKWLEVNIGLNKVGDFVKAYNTDGREFIKESTKLIYEHSNKEKAIELPRPKKKAKFTNESKEISNLKKEIPKFFTQYVMNLPDSAITFLDAFIGLYSKNGFTKDEMYSIPGFKLPVINFHHFEKFSPDEKPEPSNEELYKRIHLKVKKLINYDINFEDMSFHLVRKVAPTKPMYCISFTLPEEVAFLDTAKISHDNK
ncbi:hypothetical protein PACTADRAFT_38626 [Pachysolen tannophilus NRRL Y-2460]|uniref:tRNA (guanine(37)-N1)-methyltransferase n=1 Tax=Pachysolen tannophilus NRRL Y-2460 TaxID=669874 RepID=A0A1E4U028_PACTA|nr:hypothetical protein PACTADRAFT_38626 [Pachysolen tannophilus NRRL Y-2460]